MRLAWVTIVLILSFFFLFLAGMCFLSIPQGKTIEVVEMRQEHSQIIVEAVDGMSWVLHSQDPQLDYQRYNESGMYCIEEEGFVIRAISEGPCR
jgi:hypothetical protein